MKQIKNYKIIEEYADGTVRIEYPTYCNGIYNGYESLTISKKDLTNLPLYAIINSQ